MENHNNLMPDNSFDESKQIIIDPSIESETMSSLEPEFRDKIIQFKKNIFTLDQFNEFFRALNSTDILLQHQGCIGIRKLLQRQPPPIQLTIDTNCIPRLIEFVKQSAYPNLQLEAIWCLTNIASGSTLQTKILIDNGVIPLLCKLLVSPFQEIVEQATHTLGNISSDCSAYRDMILKYNGLTHIASILMKTNNFRIIMQFTWCLSSFCRVQPRPQYEIIQDAIQPLCKVIMTASNQNILIDSSWALHSLSCLSNGNEERIQRIIDTGVIPDLLRLTNSESLNITIPCLQTIGQLCTGSSEQVQQILSHNPIPQIFNLIKHNRKAVRIQSCIVLSRIAAGSDLNKLQIINEEQYVQSLFECMQSSVEVLPLEATQVICNCSSTVNPYIIHRLVDYNILKIYTDILRTSDIPRIIILILESLKYILQCGQINFMEGNKNPFTIQLETLGSVDLIEELQNNFEDDKIYINSLSILEDFFSERMN